MKAGVRWAVMVVVFTIAAWSADGRTAAGSGDCADDIAVAAGWIVSLQYSASSTPGYGAIKVHHDPGLYIGDVAYFRVAPYNANLGVNGLLRSSDFRKLEVAERWIDWYLGHSDSEGTPGVVHDHWYQADGQGESTCPSGILCNRADSYDSYAATFLGMAWTYYESGGSPTFLNSRGNKEKFEAIADLVLSLQQSDGLTWTKPDYRVKFVMDNSEVYWGLDSMAKLESRVFKDPRAANRYREAARRVRDGIKSELYNPEIGLYRVAKLENGLFQEANPEEWYPGTVALAWPHLFGVVPPHSARSRNMMDVLNEKWDWTSHVVDRAGFLWPSIGFAALVSGDPARAEAHATFLKSQVFPEFRSPFTVDDAGWLIRTLAGLG